MRGYYNDGSCEDTRQGDRLQPDRQDAREGLPELGQERQRAVRRGTQGPSGVSTYYNAGLRE